MEVRQQNEATPETYPAAPAGLSTAAAALADVAWARLESYIAHRYTARDVTWIVEGPGEFVPPLTPATVSTVEVWSAAGVWDDCTPPASPLGGYWLSATGPFRFTATVGADAGDVPPAVEEAVRRLAEYLAADPGTPGATSENHAVEGVDSVQVARSASWMARALHNSGAADLLRNYRRA
jgi:hypothetical protein